MLFRKKYVMFFFLLVLTLLLSACDVLGGSPATATPTPHKLVKATADKQIYTTPITGISDITTLDPALVADAPSVTAVQMITAGLVQLDDNQQIRGQLAASWSQSSDGLSWTFHLKPNLKFSDGSPLTAQDVAYSIDRALQPATKSTTAAVYLDLIRGSDRLLAGRATTLIGESLLVIDNSTLTIVLKRKAEYFLSMLTYPCSYVVEKSLVDKYGVAFPDHLTEGGDSGPFLLSAWNHGKDIEFVPNPNYIGPQPQLHKVIFPFYQDPATAYQAYAAGKADTSSVPLSGLNAAKQGHEFHQVPQLWTNYYTMNYLVKPFDNINIRRAFALAIDKTAIANKVWKDTVLPTNHIVPQGMAGYNPTLTGPDGTSSLKGNATMAVALLQQGMKDEGYSSIAQLPAITLSYASDVTHLDQEVAMLQQMWQSVLGVQVKTDPEPFNTLADKIVASTSNANGLQFWGFTWVAEYPDPQNWLTLQFDKGVPNNNMSYGENASSDATAQQNTQRQLEDADVNTSTGTRIQAYQKAEQQLVNDVAWLPMEQITTSYLRQSWVIGMTGNAQGWIPPDDWANIYIAQH